MSTPHLFVQAKEKDSVDVRTEACMKTGMKTCMENCMNIVCTKGWCMNKCMQTTSHLNANKHAYIIITCSYNAHAPQPCCCHTSFHTSVHASVHTSFHTSFHTSVHTHVHTSCHTSLHASFLTSFHAHVHTVLLLSLNTQIRCEHASWKLMYQLLVHGGLK